jgi:hypothetical protein
MCELRLEADVEVGISPQSLDTNVIVDNIETQWDFLRDRYGVLFQIGKHTTGGSMLLVLRRSAFITRTNSLIESPVGAFCYLARGLPRKPLGGCSLAPCG